MLGHRQEQKKKILDGLKDKISERNNNKVSEENKPYMEDMEEVEEALVRLFPYIGLPEEFRKDDLHSIQRSAPLLRHIKSRPDTQRFVSSPKQFDTCFQLRVGDDTLKQSEIDDIIERADDADYIRKKFLESSRAMVRLQIKDQVHKIPNEKIQPLLTTLFSIADKMLENEMRHGGDWPGDVYGEMYQLVCDWYLHRESPEGIDPSIVLMEASRKASLGWLLYFAYQLKKEEEERDRGDTRGSFIFGDEPPAFFQAGDVRS